MSDQNVLWSPHGGPQTRFLQATEFEVLYGGAAGGGKSDALMWGALRYVHIPQFRALILRLTMPELNELIDRSQVWKSFGAVWHEGKKQWTFPSGAKIEFGYFEQWKHHTRYQGREFHYIAWDELGTCPEERFWTFLMSRCRSAIQGLPALMRGSANPGGVGHAWVKRRFIDSCGEDGAKVYVDPETGLERRFVPSRVTDNPALVENDPGYVKRLQALPDVMKRQLLDGDWGAATGLALHMVRSEHMVPRFEVPGHWWYFGALDWGFAHPMAFGIFAVSDDGVIALVDSVHLWRRQPREQIQRVRDKLLELGGGRESVYLRYTVAGHDCWADIRARGETVPTIAEQWAEAGLPLMQASISRVAGLNNVRKYLSLSDEHGEPSPPRFILMDTPGNRATYDCLEGTVIDPADMEDSLKVDADDYGVGGDDPYDMVRYGLASRPVDARLPQEKPAKDRNHHDGLTRAIKHINQMQRVRKPRRIR